MNKESIYKIIGYRGEYTENVKKALRKLLKDNHPDRKGNSEIFKLVNEVKKELENNQVSFKYTNEKNEKVYDDIDYNYCHLMIEKLKKEKDVLLNKKEEIRSKNSILSSNYRKLYRNSIDEIGLLLNKNDYSDRLIKIKKFSIILTIIIIILFIIAVIKNSLIIFIIFGVMCILTITVIEKYFMILNSLSKKSDIKLSKYLNSIEEIKNNTEEQEKNNQELLDIERNITKIENNIRFYENLLK